MTDATRDPHLLSRHLPPGWACGESDEDPLVKLLDEQGLVRYIGEVDAAWAFLAGYRNCAEDVAARLQKLVRR